MSLLNVEMEAASAAGESRPVDSDGFSSDSDSSADEGASIAKLTKAKSDKMAKDGRAVQFTGTAALLNRPSALSRFDADFAEDEDDNGGISVTNVPASLHEPAQRTNTGLPCALLQAAIDIRIQQRTTHKSVTTLQGLPDQFDLKHMLKYFKKTFGCLGAVVTDKTYGKVIQLAGDQRIKLRDFLIEEKIAEKKDIVVHGF
ncbi:Eukaryotic translation initiation factor eIF-1 [Coemansia nantahalensis]|uniref:Eukaryotic translation initiation factor eIF-1 n=1 Tax=Coemansia nantahalensis TaxID=2789366 RepID=A0ACC1JYU2_9FUNG|nr:Eukaryotic translation initiation factor eIF-1 [Coemansia nantahalensis]